MKQTIFTNERFRVVILAVLCLLIAVNLYQFLTSWNLLALLPLGIQSFVLALILTKDKHAKLGVKVFSLILIIGPSLSFLGRLLNVMMGDDLSSSMLSLLKNALLIALGIAILIFTNRHIQVIDKKET